ncbi:MAG: iron ABC transporter permease [Desulfobacterales bacterium]|nr:MAG: iron ABC transporter permease [Desulfobacterales bacterium]
MFRQLPGYVLTCIVGLLLLVFIALPFCAVLLESFTVSGPLPLRELRAITLEALEHLDPETRQTTVTQWVVKANARQRMEAVAASLELLDLPVPWDRKATFDEQIAAAEKTVANLDPAIRKKLEELYPVSFVMLHKRIPLAFQIKKHVSEKEFEVLRMGARKGFGLRHYLSVLIEARLQKAAKNSLLLAMIASIATTLVAFALSYGINRGGIPFPNLMRYATLTPLVSPPVMIATAAILLFGRNGVITRGVLDQTLGWINADESNLYGMGGVIVAQILSFLPPAFIILDNVLSKHDGRVEEAAASQGAGPWQVFTRVSLPLSQPGIIRSLILCFILSMTDFGNPLVIGKDMPVLAGILYDEIIGFQNTELSAALAVWIIVPALCIYFLLERIGRRKRFDTGNVAGGPPELPVPLVAKIIISGLGLIVVALIVLVYGSVVVGSFVKLWGIDNTFTPHWYTAKEAMPGFVSEWKGVEAVWSSVKVSIIGAPIGGILAAVLSYLVERVRPVGRNLLSFVALSPAILPGVIFGIGYVIAFNFPFGVKELALTGTMWILVLNLTFGHLYVGVLAGRAALQRLDASVDEAAEILGATLIQRFIRVILPMMRHAAILGTLYVFVQAMTSLSSVVFLVSPGHKLGSVAIFDMASVSQYGPACAMSVTMLLIVFGVMGFIAWFEKFGPRWARLAEH